MKLNPEEQIIFDECLRKTSPSANARALFQLQFAAGTTKVTAEDLPEIRAFLSEIYEPRSARAVQRHEVQISKTVIADRNCLDIRTLGRDRPKKTLLYFFGGGHITGNPEQDLPITAALARYGSMRVISPNYRLSPEHLYPAALEDALAVYLDLLKSIPAADLLLAGESAGGNLALALVERLKSLGIALPARMALLSPWCDLSPENTYGGEPQEFDPTINLANLYTAANFYVSGSNPVLPEISPVFAQFDREFPKTMITTGSRDRMLFDILRLVAGMRVQGLAPNLAIWPDMGHVFEFYDEIPEADMSLREIANFLTQ